MSTRSRIGIIRGENRVESIYCHFDGYPEGVGQILLDHWTDPKKVEKLIALGDLSSLGSVIGRKHDFDHHLPSTFGVEFSKATAGMSEDEVSEYRLELHRNSPQGKGWCNAYMRDRGEKDCGSRTHPLDEWPDYGQEAQYLFDPETCEWRVMSEMLNPVGWNTVAQWDGWVTIPEAIQRNLALQQEWAEKEKVS